MTGCAKIIGLDRVKSRLELAKTLGATDGIDTSSADLNVVEQVHKLTGEEGATIVIDTTGVPALLEAGLQFTASRGKLIFVGAPPQDYALSVHVITHLTVCCFPFQRDGSPARAKAMPCARIFADLDYPQTGKCVMGNVEGDSIPEKVCIKDTVLESISDRLQFVPELINWYHDGKFPIDRVVKFFKVRITPDEKFCISNNLTMGSPCRSMTSNMRSMKCIQEQPSSRSCCGSPEPRPNTFHPEWFRLFRSLLRNISPLVKKLLPHEDAGLIFLNLFLSLTRGVVFANSSVSTQREMISGASPDALAVNLLCPSGCLQLTCCESSDGL